MSHPKGSQSLEVAAQVPHRNLFPLGKKVLGKVWEGFPVEAGRRGSIVLWARRRREALRSAANIPRALLTGRA